MFSRVRSVRPAIRTRARRAPGAIVCALVFAAAAALAAGTHEEATTVAVFPVENLTGGTVPDQAVRRDLIEGLVNAGIRVLAPESLDAFFARHRIRYVAGLDIEAADWLKQETAVEGIVIPSFELSSETVPPKVALVVRFVSLDTPPAVRWAGDEGLAGDDSPGWLELGLVNDYQELLTRATDRLTGALVAYLRTGTGGTHSRPASKFKPKSAYRGLTLEPGRPYSIAVMPFFNSSERRNAGEIVSLLCIRHLAAMPQFRVIDTGVVRRQLLDARIVMDSGLSVTDAETVAALIDADFVLGGQVFRYEDHEGPGGRTGVEFSTTLIDRRSRRVVWKSRSYNEGTDGVRFFERGTSRTAHAMATQMVRFTAEMIAGRDR